MTWHVTWREKEQHSLNKNCMKSLLLREREKKSTHSYRLEFTLGTNDLIVNLTFRYPLEFKRDETDWKDALLNTLKKLILFIKLN